jgi:hypothetical protein
MSEYKDPNKETLSNGVPIAAVMRGDKGMKGVIVSPAGVDGRSTGFNPHDKSTIAINIEPDSGNGQTLSLSQFTKESVRAAMKAAEEKITGNDIHAIRERTAVAFEELSKIANSGVVKKATSTTTRVPDPPQPEPDLDEDAVFPETVDRTYSPMAAFGLKRSKTQAAAVPSAPKPNRDAGPPAKLLYFEKEGIGTVPAFFHDVVVDVNFDDEELIETGFIVLVYDLRYEQATARWFPPAHDPYNRPWALQISNDRRLYLVQPSGFQYVYDNREFCVLSVIKAVTSDI